MINHTLIYSVGFSVLGLWLIALVGYLPPVERRLRVPLGHAALVAGCLVMAGYLGWLWVTLERPPARTTVETLQWCTLFLPVIGLVCGLRWRARILIVVTLITAMALIVPLLLKPEIPDRALMPALQSPWFAPHVLAYIFSYAIFTVAAVVAAALLIYSYFEPGRLGDLSHSAELARRLVYIGFPFLSIGLLLGAYWAKIAWGNYWTWDPKETWAFITWAAYLAYLHLEARFRLHPRTQLYLVVAAFLVIPICWFGVNYLPTAQNSVHTYTQ